MSSHAFIDEVRRADYVLCAAVLASADLMQARRVMRELKPSNRRRLHMHSEGAANRRKILSEFVRRCPLAAAHVWTAPLDGRPERMVRDQCLRRLVPDLVRLGVERLVVESCSQDAQDVHAIAGALATEGAIRQVRFDIVPAPAEELLWAADVIGWAWGAGGQHRRMVEHLVVVHHVR